MDWEKSNSKLHRNCMDHWSYTCTVWNVSTVILFPFSKVKYKGKKLDQFKTTWFRKQNPVSDKYFCLQVYVLVLHCMCTVQGCQIVVLASWPVKCAGYRTFGFHETILVLHHFCLIFTLLLHPRPGLNNS